VPFFTTANVPPVGLAMTLARVKTPPVALTVPKPRRVVPAPEA